MLIVWIAVVQADGATSNMDISISRPIRGRDNIDNASGERSVTLSKFNVMRRRIELFLVPFPHGCTWPLDAPRKNKPATEEIAVSTNNRDEDYVIQNPELKRRERRLEHAALNILPRQVSEVTVTTTTTTKVSAQAAEVKTVTATATAIETIGATVGGGAKNNGTEASTNPAAENASMTKAAEAESSSPPAEAVSISASPAVEGSASAEASASSTQAILDPAAQTSAAGEASSTAVEQPTGSTSAPATTTQTARAGVEGFQNAEGISVPLEIVGENVSKPESNAASGLPLTPDANQPIPTTAGVDLPVPTFSPGKGAGSGTLLQPDELRGQGQTPAQAPDTQTPAVRDQTPSATIDPSDEEAPQASATATESQAPTEAASSALGPSTDVAEGVSNNGQTEAKQDKRLASDSQDVEVGDANGAMVDGLQPEDVLTLLKAGTPKIVMKREEWKAWTELEGRIVARRSEHQRAGGLHMRTARRSRTVF